MVNFAVYYIEALVACILLFLVIFVNNRFNIDRQEKQIKLDRALISFMLYFVVDCFWAAIVGGYLPKERLYVILDDFALYLSMAAICYFWLEYILAVEQIPNRNRPLNRFATLFPFIVATTVLVINFIAQPETLIDDAYNTLPRYSIYLMTAPVVYLVAILFYTITRAVKEENPAERRRHLYIGFLPLTTVIAGLIQETIFPLIPIYCFVDSLLVLIFYIQSIEARVSVDPLTNLNNRGELMRYVSQKSNIYQDNRLTVVAMMDINNFKTINDTYGHAEGDKALVTIADSMKKAFRNYGMPAFLGRYGGDEFIFIIHPETGSDVEQLVSGIRYSIQREINENESKFDLTFSVGYAELNGKDETIQNCIRRADAALYQDKNNFKTGNR